MSAAVEAPSKVIGIGNRWRRDDAAGLIAAQRIRSTAPPGVSVVELEGEPISLLEAWQPGDAVIVIDAIASGAPPGTVHRVDALAGELPDGLERFSTHAIGLRDAIELGRVLGRLPSRLVVIGVEGESFDSGDGLTPAVERALDEVVEAAGAELSGAGPQSG